jgi:DNA (cytosine-5)-methyltransferase 1
MKRYIVRKLGVSKGCPRVYLDIDAMAGSGFLPGKTYTRHVDEEGRRLTLTVEPNGNYVVCKKSRSDGSELPIIDIHSSEALKMFEGLMAVRIVLQENTIHILPIASEVKRVERLKRLKAHLDDDGLTTAGLSFGGGVPDHAAHVGLKDCGLDATLTMAIEIDEELLNHAVAHNDVWNTNTIAIAAPMQELVQDDAAMAKLPRCDILAAGIPCSGASQAGKSKRKIDMMELHPEVGHLMASAIMVINRIQPAVIVIENVAPYSETASAQILRQHLRDSGYDVQETTLGAHDFGCLENRVRWFLAATRGIDIDLKGLVPVVHPVPVLGDVLENIEASADNWRTFDYLKTKEVRDAAKGSSFAMQVVTPASTSCPTLRKGYAKSGSTDPLLAHPTDPNLLRQLTVKEHARIKQVPAHLVEGLSATAGHILLGQGIAYAPVRALFKRIGASLVQWKESLNGVVQQQNIGYNLMRATG